MGFWGALEETVVDGSAGAVGLGGAIPVYGEAFDATAAAIHGVDAAGHYVAAGVDALTGDSKGAREQLSTVATQTGEAGASLIPYAGVGMAVGDLGMAATSGAVAVNNAAGGDWKTPQEHINHWVTGEE